jgi:hypothetical protein
LASGAIGQKSPFFFVSFFFGEAKKKEKVTWAGDASKTKFRNFHFCTNKKNEGCGTLAHSQQPEANSQMLRLKQ